MNKNMTKLDKGHNNVTVSYKTSSLACKTQYCSYTQQPVEPQVTEGVEYATWQTSP